MFKNNIRSYKHCVVFFNEDYYRASLSNVPESIEDETILSVFLIDVGSVVEVTSCDIYMLTRKMYTISQFAIKASLAGVAPSESSRWSPEAVANFKQLVDQKILLGKLREADYTNKTLQLDLSDLNDTQFTKSINDALVLNKFARQSELRKAGEDSETCLQLRLQSALLTPEFSSEC
ncbi:hypothetical protein GWI33_014590 [Rhynchophorus ferrugineus]|uniref:Tudor domain-containing protein n=1 Tax=Rhynchophorus ferrugineus TaxID=354439 RepID=A0A834M5C4_RHYFE|nr:hypothetical protein GWI33_014590 [Rhynchophorus ferrugineus]